ncbi:DUF4912 domain-containing protein [Bacillus dakarensis]|uniref:DUF4912 domain-containing protein n=1 Tax=Robertmurraya dakarensis TaxID=1926278 RepID=UPI00098163C4|nr:DUF4912 domain-containing protein [Bacillus dakarensis]
MDEGFSLTLINDGEAKITWHLSPQKIQLISLFFDRLPYTFVKALRIYQLQNHEFNGNHACFYELELQQEDTSCLYNNFTMGQSYIFEVGIKLDEKTFIPLLRSSLFSIHDEYVREEIDYFKVNDSSPDWAERVSTYSLYENFNDGWKL